MGKALSCCSFARVCPCNGHDDVVVVAVVVAAASAATLMMFDSSTSAAPQKTMRAKRAPLAAGRQTEGRALAALQRRASATLSWLLAEREILINYMGPLRCWSPFRNRAR